MNQRLQDEIKLFLAEAGVQILGYKREGLVFKILGLDTRQRNIIRERRKMTTSLWYEILNYYKWTCARCKMQNWKNSEPFKDKMEVDHVQSLYEWGKTEWKNLQVLCKPHNRQKGTKFRDYRNL